MVSIDRWTKTALVGLVVLAVAAACGGPGRPDSATSPTSTSLPSRNDTVPVDTVPVDDDRILPEGFRLMTARVTQAADDMAAVSCDLCLWVADDPVSRSRGLMFVTDLGGVDGMAFVFDRPTTTAFTMRNTVLPLTIVFYGPDGRYVDAFDMEPCSDEPCRSYPTPVGVSVAVEIPQGSAEELKMVPGSRLEVLADTAPFGCHTHPAD